MNLKLLFEKMFNYFYARSLKVFLLSLVLIVFAAFKITSIYFELDLYDILDPSLKSSTYQFTMREEYADLNSIFVSLHSDEQMTNAQLCLVKKFAQNVSNKSQEIEKISAPWVLRKPQVEGDYLWYLPVIKDPCLEEEKSVLLSKSYSVLDQTPWQFFYLGKNNNQVSFEVAFKDQIDNNGKRKFDVGMIDRFSKSLKEFLSEHMPNVSHHIFGQVSLRWHIMETMKKDLIWNIAIILFLVVFFYYFLGTWRSGLYYAITLIVTDIFIFGTMAMIGFPIDLMTNCLVLMVAISGVSDYLFVSSAQKEDEHWAKSFREVMAPSFFTAATTVLGFISLGLSEIPSISRFGYIAAIGAGYKWFTTFIFLPSVLEIFKVKKTWVCNHGRLQVNAPWFLKMNNYTPGRIVTTVLISFGFLSGFGILKLNIGDDILKNFPSGNAVREAYGWLQDDKGWQGQMFVLFAPDVAPEFVKSTLVNLKKLKHIKHVEDPVEIEDFLTHNLSPGKRDLVLRDLSDIVLSRYKSKNGYLRVPVYTTSLDVEVIRGLSKEIESICNHQCHPAGHTIVYLEYSDRISQSLVDSLFFSVLSIALLIILVAYAQGASHIPSLILSSLWGPLIMVGVMSLFQVRVTSVTSIFFSLIVGWTGDNAIQYMFANKEDVLDGAKERASATLMQTLLFMGSSVFFTFHSLVPMRVLGFLFIVGFFVTYIGDLWILKGLINFKKSSSSNKV